MKKSEHKNCPSCQAMRNRLISIVKGCKSVVNLPDGKDHDENCFDRDLVLSGIYSIAIGNHNWPEAMPYDPITEDEIKIKKGKEPMKHTEKIELALDAIESDKKHMALIRDRLRARVDDLEGLAQSLDEGIENLENGMRYFQSALDDFSQYV